jgi:hypothetical protein
MLTVRAARRPPESFGTQSRFGELREIRVGEKGNKEVLAALTGLRRSALPLTKAVFALSEKDDSVGLDSAERLSGA